MKLWGLPGCEKQLTIKAHDSRITGGRPCHSANVSTGMWGTILMCPCAPYSKEHSA